MLSKLPRDILLQDILPLLDYKCLVHLSFVSTHFNYLANDEHIWKRLCFDDFNISHDTAFRNKGWKQFYKDLVNTKVYSWGENVDRRLGLTEPPTPVDPTQFHIRNPHASARFRRYVTSPQEVTYLQNKGIIDITAGGWSFHALDTSGSVWTWGTMQQEISPRNSIGTKRLLQPTRIQETNGIQEKISFRSISSGRAHVIGLARDGSVWHWSNHVVLQRVVLDLDRDETIVQVAANWNYSSALTNTGSFYLIPRPDLIAPNQEHARPLSTWVVTPKLTFDDFFPAATEEDKIVQIAGLDNYTIALTRLGRVLKLSTKNGEELAANPLHHVIELLYFGAHNTEEVNDRNGVMQRFVTGTFNNFAVYTNSGQVLLGTVDAVQDTVPKKLHDLQNRGVCKVSFADYHFGALTNDGKLFTWGNYSSGALGHGTDSTETSQETPKVVEALNDMFVFAIGFGGWQSSVLAVPLNNFHQEQHEEEYGNSNFIRTN